MNSKQIVFTKVGCAELLEHDPGLPGANQVRVRLMASSVSSGTERANLLGSLNTSRKRIHTEPVFPCILGYSAAGIIDAVGEGVQDYACGDRVALTWSSHSQYQCIHVKNVHKLPDEIDFFTAALLHIGVFPMAAIRKTHLEAGESAIVMGLGILGLFAVQLLHAAGAVPVIAVDPLPEKREKALQCGADYALDPMDPDFAKTVMEITKGGANVGIEVTGIGAGLNGILDCMAMMGRVALLGCTRNSDFTIDYYRKVHGRGVSLIGAHTSARPLVESSSGLWTLRDDMAALMKLSRFGRIHFGDMVDEIHTPEEAPEVYTRLANEKAFPIVQFDWRDLK